MNIVTYLRNLLLGKLTTDGVMSVFNKTIRLLKVVEDEQRKEEQKQIAIVDEAMAAANAAVDERVKAAAIRTKLEAIAQA